MEIEDFILEKLSKYDAVFLENEDFYIYPDIPVNVIKNDYLNKIKADNTNILWVYKDSEKNLSFITKDFISLFNQEKNDKITIYWRELKKIEYSIKGGMLIFYSIYSKPSIEINYRNFCLSIKHLKILHKFFNEVLEFYKDKNNLSVSDDVSVNDIDTLDSLTNDLMKAIFGIFKFIFYFVPKTLFKLIKNVFPVIIKLIKVLILFTIWLLIISMPVVLTFYKTNEVLLHKFANTIDFNLLLNININFLNQILYNKFFIIWTPLSIIGSLWGIKNIRTNLLDNIKKIFRKKRV